MGIETFAPLMSTFGAAAPAMQVAGMATGAFGAYQSSQAMRASHDAQAQVASNNAIIAGWQADDALQRGGKSATAVRIKTGLLKGEQRAAMAANGIDLGVGSALELLTDTDYFGAIDANTVLDNAGREAWALRNQASGFTADAATARARAAAERPGMAAGQSLLTSAGKVSGSWYSGGSASSPLSSYSGDGLSQGDRRKRGVY